MRTDDLREWAHDARNLINTIDGSGVKLPWHVRPGYREACQTVDRVEAALAQQADLGFLPVPLLWLLYTATAGGGAYVVLKASQNLGVAADAVGQAAKNLIDRVGTAMTYAAYVGVAAFAWSFARKRFG